MNILVIGDLITDRTCYGHITRDCPEAVGVPVLVIDREIETDGGAGLVVAQLKALGCVKVTAEYGSRSLKERIYANNKMLCRIDTDSYEVTGVSKALCLKAYDSIIVSDYAKGALIEEDAKRLVASGVRLYVDAKKNWNWYKGPNTVLVPNIIEALGAKEEDFLAIVRKLGEKGASLNDEVISTIPVEVADTCGCGDNFIAALVWHISLNTKATGIKIPLTQAIKYANRIAGVAAEHTGTCVVSPEEVPSKFRETRAGRNGWDSTAYSRALWYRYKRTPADYEEQLKTQNGLCLLCGQPARDERLVWDHDHKCCDTNNRKTCGRCVRGLIHDKCNRVIGNAQDDTELLRKCIQYLEGKQ